MQNALRISTIAALLLISSPLWAQNKAGDVFVPIGKYIVKGDAEKLSAWFNDNLEISVTPHSSTASKTQAKQIIKSFFDSNTPQSFEITHTAQRGNMEYAQGKLEAGGNSYNITIFVSYRSGAYKIQQIAIEKR